MATIFEKIAQGVKTVAPIAADLALPGSGRILSGLMRLVTGDSEQTPIEQVAAKIDADPKLMVELKRLAVEREIELKRIASADLNTVNETMRAESKSERWPQYSWRPFNGFTFPLAVILIYFVLPICKAAVPDVPQWVWVGWLSILGVATWDRGKEKRAKAGEDKPGLIAGAINAIRGANG